MSWRPRKESLLRREDESTAPNAVDRSMCTTQIVLNQKAVRLLNRKLEVGSSWVGGSIMSS